MTCKKTLRVIDEIAQSRLSRRQVVRNAAVLGSSIPALTLASGNATNLAAQEATDRPVLRLGTGAADIGTMEPHFASNIQDRIIVDMVFNGLVRYTPGTVTEFLPDIAVDLPVATDNDDGTQTWTISLRDDVMAHPSEAAGTESYAITSADVVFSLEKAANPESSNYASNYAGWSFAAVDDKTVEITLQQPLSETLFFTNISNYSGGFIIPQQPFEALGPDGFVTNPVGTGPFSFENYTPLSHIALTAFDNFHRGSPLLGGVEVRLIADMTSRELALQSGELDVIHGLGDTRWVDRINELEGISVDVFGVGETTWLNINTSVEPFDDPLVREAIILAIDRDNHVALAGEPVVEKVYSPVASQVNLGGLTEEDADNAGVNYEQDIDQAKALLAEAGYPDGFEIQLISSELPSYLQHYEVLAEQLRQIGITVELEVVQHAAMHELIREDVNALTLYGGYRPNADIFLTQFFTSGSDGTPNVTNFSKFDVSELVEAARETTKPEEQADLWKEANIRILEAYAGYGIVIKNQVYARSETVDYGHELDAVINLYPGIDETTLINR